MQATTAQQGTNSQAALPHAPQGTLARSEYAAFYLCSATRLSKSAEQLDTLHTKLRGRRAEGNGIRGAVWDGYWFVNEKANDRIASLSKHGGLLHYGCPAALEAAKAIEAARDAALLAKVAA
ncbi:MAG: hypothetical protein QM740_19090 [Acidovorax sp.]